MIASFRHKALQRLFERGEIRRLPAEHIRKLELILAVLNEAESVDHIDVATLRLHRLTGEYKGFWSVTVRANWRVIFRFENGQVHDVDYLDYH